MRRFGHTFRHTQSNGGARVAIAVPDAEGLAKLNERYAFGLSDAEIAEFVPIVAGTLRASERVEELYNAVAPTPPQRDWTAPTENHLGGWYVKTSISGATEGLLAGKTVAVKDNISVAGIPMMNGSRTVEGFVPSRDATVVTRLLEAGATIVGKAVCEDMCFSGGSFTSKPGPVLNPWDPTRIAGGSSSGSGALVASGAVDLAVGGDQGGSVRIPCAFSGAVGHKPTFGLVPYTGAFPIERTIDHLGPMTRTVADTAAMLTVLAGVDGFDPRQPTVIDRVDYLGALAGPTAHLRIGVLREGFGTDVSDPAVDDAVRLAIEVLRESGLTVDEVSIPSHVDALAIWNVIGTEGAAFQMIDGNAYGMNAQGLYDPELIAHFAAGRVARGKDLAAPVKLVGLSGRYTFEQGGGKFYAMARNLVYGVRKAYDDILASFDLLAMPTLPYTAPLFPPPGASPATEIETALGMLANCAPFNISGHPACTVPAGLVEGLPTGMMLVGKHFDDATVLQVAHTYEQAVGGFPTPPLGYEMTRYPAASML
jgi:amidase